jgi:hypothetical protein
MPGLIGSQGVRPGALNMNRVFRALRYRTEQAQKVTYHRPAIFDTDDYGVPSGTSATSPEILLPDLPAIIRPAVTADYQQQKQGSNIIGAARIYTPNITTIKNLPNFDQDNNTNFNEIEGWDRLITNYRTIYSVPTSVTGNWSTGGSATFTSDGESLTTTLTGLFANSITFTPSSPVNTLEADRMRFKVKASGSVSLRWVASYNGGSTGDHYVLWDASPDFVLLDDNWLTIDVPFISGTSSTSIYQTGSRNPVTVSTGSSFDYEGTMNKIVFDFSGDTNDTIQIKEVEYYKSVSWHVHSLKDMTDGYIIFNCVRTSGRDDAKRRAYE